MLNRKYLPAAGASPSQRAASTRKKCPLENTSTLPLIAPTAIDDPVGSRTNLFGRFTTRASISKQLPIGALGVDLGRPLPFVFAVIPLHQIRAQLPPPRRTQPARKSATARCNGLVNTRRELNALQSFAKLPSVVFAALGQRQIGQASVLAGQAPLRLAMPRQINDRKIVAHICWSAVAASIVTAGLRATSKILAAAAAVTGAPRIRPLASRWQMHR